MDSQSALSALNSFQPTSSADLMSQAQAKYGIPDLSNRVQALTGITNNLTNSIAAVDPSVTGRTAGSLVTEGQRSALVNREKQPLLTDLSSNNQSLDTARGDLNTNQSFADQLASALANDQTTKYNQLKDQYTISKAAEDAKAAQELEQQKLDLGYYQADQGSGGNITINPSNPTPTPTNAASSTTLRQTWQQEAKAGDWNAQVALNYAGNDGRYDGKVNSQAEYNILKQLGITGNYYVAAAPKAAPKSVAKAPTLSIGHL